jgi:TonB family protein
MSILEDRHIEERHIEDRQVKETLVVFERHSAMKQRRQMLMALGVLCVALLLVVVKDWSFWFPSNTTAESAPPTATTTSASAEPKIEMATPVTPLRAKRKTAAQPTPPPPAAHVASSESLPEAMGPNIIATQRRALPPLEVEVIAGNSHRPLQPKNNTVKVDLQDQMTEPVTKASATTIEPVTRTLADTPISQPVAAASATSLKPIFQPAVEAPAQVHMSAQTAQVVARPVDPSYPLLAKQMKVQGAVVLQALIGRSGGIDDLHVLSGPAILSSAAMEAVKQWRFKPYLQDGKPVDTQARITVNFTISTF